MNIRKIYLNNFRGFKDTSIPFKNVNFLVGENSTGKTSLLSLIELITSNDFWFRGALTTSNIDLGYFGDIYGEGYTDPSAVTKIAILYDTSSQSNAQTLLQAISVEIQGRGKNNRSTITGIKCVTRSKVVEYYVDSRETKSFNIVDEYKDYKVSFEDWAKLDIDRTKSTVEINSKNSPSYFLSSGPYFTLILGFRELNIDDGNPDALIDFNHTSRWMAPIRVKPRVTYDENIYEYSPEGAHTPYILKTILSDNSKTVGNKKIAEALVRFGKESRLFDTINVEPYTTEGNSPFRITVKLDGKKRHITEVGYGVSQVLPIVTEMLNKSDIKTICIQQPEVHLHPKAQASLGELIYESTKASDNTFVIETHSDFMIDRFRQMKSSNQDKGPSAQTLFFERDKAGNHIHAIDIADNGKYSSDQPDNFKKFFFDEAINNIAI